MRIFIIRLLKFFFLPIFVYLSILLLLKIKKDEKEKVWRNIAVANKIILMGDSEMQRIPVDVINDSVYNFANIAEHYYFTYLKLKKLLSYTDHEIQTVLLSISFHNFAPVYQRYFDINTPEGNSSFERYFYNLPFKNTDFIDIITFQKKIIHSLHYLLKVKNNWGFVESLIENPTDKIIDEGLSRHFDHPNTNECLNQLIYLADIIDLCKYNNVRLVFVSMPVHSNFKNKVELKYFKILADFINDNKEIEYQNYLLQEISGKYMADGNHLNKNGGVLIGNFIKDGLKTRTHNKVYLP